MPVLPAEPHGRAIDPQQLAHVRATLEAAGQRFTRQREALARLLFGIKDNHFTAEMLFQASQGLNDRLSIATVYNTLSLFSQLGLLQRVAVDGSKTYYDTNVALHQHFYVEDARELLDIPATSLVVSPMASVPADYVVSRIDVVVRIRKRKYQDNRACDLSPKRGAWLHV